jgi:hypothetical protein
MPPLSISEGDLRRLVEIATKSIRAACTRRQAPRMAQAA